MLKVADEAWLATALLHREHPEAADFRIADILARAVREFHDRRPGVWAHIVSHCVASNPPSPAQYRMLHETGRGRRRLYRPGDPVHPKRKGKVHPDKHSLPPEYQALVDWYDREFTARTASRGNGGKRPGIARFVGLIPAFDLEKMAAAIEEGCERVEEE
jgi:hypothetical protein